MGYGLLVCPLSILPARTMSRAARDVTRMVLPVKNAPSESAFLRDAGLLATNWVICLPCKVHWCWIARTGGFSGGREFGAIEDYVLWLRAAALTEFAYCSSALVYYRDGPEGSVRGEQEISPDMQRNLVLGETKRWHLSGDLGAAT